MWFSRWLAALVLLVGSVAGAQVGQKVDSLLASAAFKDVKPNSAGLMTLPDGAALALRVRQGFLVGARVIVRQGLPTGLVVTGGTAGASGSAGANAGGAGVRRAAGLIGLLSGYGDGMAQPLQAFLNRADVVARLPQGVTVTAAPFQVRAETQGQLLSLDLSLARIEAGQFAAAGARYVLPARSGTGRVVVRVYTDLQCPFCKQFDTQTLPALLKALPADVRLEYHHLPLEPIHPLARPAAEASECAAQQEKFWAFKDALFADAGWMQGNPNKAFIGVAGKLGLDLPRFKDCLAERDGKDAVDTGLLAAAKLGLNATPTVFVNGYRVQNPYDVAALLNLIAFARAADGGRP